MENEIWKDIKGYEGLYQVSNYGRIKSLSRTRKGTTNRNDMILIPILKDGYLVVNLYKNKRRNLLRVHRIIAQTFIPNPNNLPVINHINGNRSDNHIKNLEWCTQKDNIEHAYNIGLNKNKRSIVQFDLENNFINYWNTIKEASIKLKINNSHICDCCKNKRKSAGGYKWKYID